ncbi:MAG TPA: M1 family metallopeptidase [Flavobacteriales bacterium]|nr:M1 family metallopeptidase [Flavobacteriales bacterium]
MFARTLPFTLISVLLAACGETPQPTAVTTDHPAQVMDQHSNARPEEARITHLDLDLAVDMVAKRITGTASYDVEAKGDRIILDTDGLLIRNVTDASGTALKYMLGDSTFLGRALTVELPTGTKRFSVGYETTANSAALQWLTPKQTSGGVHPFLFTQGQAILTRTWIPVQDSPGIRFTYSAKVKVPSELMAVMSATNPMERSSDGVYSFTMENPVPAYLIALSVGDIGFAPVGERTGVYAERNVLEKAAWEFADMERMLTEAEKLYGPYRWGRYDLIVLPPSFPFGGMENPRLTFATPTILAGDRSLTALVAHELAHSWSGNLVTNATWDDFWLNEGFTVYFEQRICEAVYGKDYKDMLAVLGEQDLDETMDEMKKEGHAADTHLRLDLAGRNPDDGMTEVAYEKGCALLRTLESMVGRPSFDAFLRGYFDAHAFQSMTTDGFEAYLTEHLLQPNKLTFDLAAWVDGEGLPSNAVLPSSDRFTKVEAEVARWVAGTPAKQLATTGWTTFEWMHFQRHLPASMTDAQMNDLDDAFGFTKSGNAEVLVAWLENCIRNDHDEAYARLDQFLNTVGRRKYLIPLYTDLIATEKGRVTAQTIYKSARSNYHAVSVRTIDELLAWKDNKPPANF